MVSGYLCKRLLHNCAFRPSCGKRAHVFQVAGREAFHIRERLAQVGRQAIDDLRAPARALLSVKDRPSNVPIEKELERQKKLEKAPGSFHTVYSIHVLAVHKEVPTFLSIYRACSLTLDRCCARARLT